jgi:hypothetical protein
MKQMAQLASARDLFKGLSDKEIELIEIIEEIQEWQRQRMSGCFDDIKPGPISTSNIKYNAVEDGSCVRSSSGLSLLRGKAAIMIKIVQQVSLGISYSFSSPCRNTPSM